MGVPGQLHGRRPRKAPKHSKVLERLTISIGNLSISLIAPSIAKRAKKGGDIPSISVGISLFGVNLTAELLTSFMKFTSRKSKSNNLDDNSVVKEKQKYPEISIVGILRLRKLQKVTIAMVLLVCLILLAIVASFFLEFEIFETIFALGLSTILLFLYQLIFDYRIAKGFYANNEREARDLINFIVRESTNIDFTDKGKRKEIITEADLEDIRGRLPSPVPSYTD